MAEVAELFLHHLHLHRHHAAAEADANAADARRAEQPPIWQDHDPYDDDDDDWPYSRDIHLAGSAFDRIRSDEVDGYAVGYGDDEFEADEPLQWDSLRIEEEEEEWEEVVDRTGEEERQRSVEWEVLLAMNNIDRNSNSDLQEDYVHTSEYDVLFGQFTEHDGSFVRGSIPTARSVVESLPSVVLGLEDVENCNALCAVCKDDVVVGESVKRLPCLHHYHGDCILPWLRMRNTCPVCRFELPSDDQDYEDSRALRDNA